MGRSVTSCLAAGEVNWLELHRPGFSLRMHGAAVQPTVMWQTTWEFRGTLFWAPYKNGSYYLGYHIRVPFFGNSHMFHIGDREAVVQ